MELFVASKVLQRLLAYFDFFLFFLDEKLAVVVRFFQHNLGLETQGIMMNHVMKSVMYCVLNPVLNPVLNSVMNPVMNPVMDPVMNPVMNSVLNLVLNPVNSHRLFNSAVWKFASPNF